VTARLHTRVANRMSVGHRAWVGETQSGRSATKLEVDSAADSLLSPVAAPIEALWRECSDESCGDIVQLARDELSATELPPDRVKFLVERGIAIRSGNTVRQANRFIQRLAGERRTDVSGVRRLFEQPEDFATNIRAVLELRIAHVQAGDPELMKFIRRAVRHLPGEPDAALGSARDILDRALDLVWMAEAPGARVPESWIAHWKATEVTSGRRVQATLEYPSGSMIPEERGRQCALLRLATGQHRIRPIAARASKSTYLLIEHMSQIGDLKNHFRGEPTLTMAVAFSMAAIELAESLSRDLAS
jgi:hypothetical protein